MNVAYVLSTPNASYILERMIVPQLEEGRHGATVAGMFFYAALEGAKIDQVITL